MQNSAFARMNTRNNGCSTEQRLRTWALKPASLSSNSILLLNEACYLSFLSLIFFTCKVEMIITATILQGYCEGYCWNTILKGLSHFCMSQSTDTDCFLFQTIVLRISVQQKEKKSVLSITKDRHIYHHL